MTLSGRGKEAHLMTCRYEHKVILQPKTAWSMLKRNLSVCSNQLIQIPYSGGDGW